MAFNGSGTFVLYSPGNPVVTGTTISSTWANNTLTDIATGLSTCITKDGQTTLTANLPMGGFKLTGLGAGSTNGDSVRYEQVFATQTQGDNSTKPASTAYVDLALKNEILRNVGLAASVGSNALTISLKGADGNDPSSSNGVLVSFRDATVTSGIVSTLTVTAATSLVISSGSTMGTRNGIPFRIWIVGFNDGGTFRLGAINCLTTVAGAGAGSDVTSIYPLSAWGVASSTAEGGAGAADNAGVFYTGTAVTSKAYTVLGYLTFESGQATAGTWASSASRTQIYSQSIPLPGQMVQVARTDTGAVATGSTLIPKDDTIPQNTEGDQYMTQAITPSSAANVLEVSSQVFCSPDTADHVQAALFQDSTANALAATAMFMGTAQGLSHVSLWKRLLSATTSATTFKVRAGRDTAAQLTFNGQLAARRYGGVANSYLEAREIMG